MKVNILTSPQVKKIVSEELDKMKIKEALDDFRTKILKIEDELTILYGTFDNTHGKKSNSYMMI